MKNLDNTNADFKALIFEAEQLSKDGKTEEAGTKFAEALNGMQQSIVNEASESVRKQVEEALASNDQRILSERGVRQLTSEEKAFYTEFIQAAKSRDPRQAVANLDKTLPNTVFESVFDHIVEEHPILGMVDFVNTGGSVEWLMDKGTRPLAAWGKLCSKIEEELEAGFEKVTLTLNKLSAYIPVCNAMLELGPVWLDKYVRTYLSEGIANGLEKAIIDGSGNDEPVGMLRNIEGANDPSTGYPTKEKTAVTSFDPASYGKIVAGLTQVQGRTRRIGELFMVVNPLDYYGKVMPSTTLMTPNGNYVNDVFPIKTEVITSAYVPEGTAVLGIKNGYFMGIGTERGGKIEKSEHARFLDDETVYKIKLYGMGKPKLNENFIALDVSGLNPLKYVVAEEPPAA